MCLIWNWWEIIAITNFTTPCHSIANIEEVNNATETTYVGESEKKEKGKWLNYECVVWSFPPLKKMFLLGIYTHNISALHTLMGFREKKSL